MNVGTVDGVPRELAEYRDANGKARIAVTTNGLWVSPAIELQQGLPPSTEYWKAEGYLPSAIASARFTKKNGLTGLNRLNGSSGF